ncbi:MAG: Gfo/Idh/MocA family oxidoreductase [Lentisphaerae bacterium]|jgi:hypothetical protein|nr:Gfo/Idh/MocA family oxidoreductase [Lentisphaerota bacterium]
MKKLGFIDLFIDEWHANNYPAWIRGSKFAADFKLHLAWEEAPKEGRRDLKQWCKDFDMIPAQSIQQVVDECDALFVLAPSNPEVHERLAEIPLKSGKPLYIDKPFAPSRAAAQRIIQLAQKHNTPLMSSSALRYSNEIIEARQKITPAEIAFVGTRGGGSSFEEYGIHQLEMIVSLIRAKASKLMQCGAGDTKHLVIEFDTGARASVTLQAALPFTLTIAAGGKTREITSTNNFFPNLLDEILNFFNTGISPIAIEETLEIATILEVAVNAQKTLDTWIKL